MLRLWNRSSPPATELLLSAGGCASPSRLPLRMRWSNRPCRQVRSTTAAGGECDPAGSAAAGTARGLPRTRFNRQIALLPRNRRPPPVEPPLRQRAGAFGPKTVAQLLSSGAVPKVLRTGPGCMHPSLAPATPQQRALPAVVARWQGCTGSGDRVWPSSFTRHERARPSVEYLPGIHFAAGRVCCNRPHSTLRLDRTGHPPAVMPRPEKK